ncbi:hypothetical protein [Methanofollis ethanolicus]|uniref:hypothetical protein n=1 Tax=Methanofollis ethanolicus TaxID=488124 RepID=UPI0008373E8B|nr:hypothetical protein [Methanofollis ethanolicus]
MTEAEAINRKDITPEITGLDIDFDKVLDEDTHRPDEPNEPEKEELNAFVGVLDMLIGSSGDLLKEYDLPPPNLKVWETWGKENLSRALNAYMPETAGYEVSSPAMAGVIGAGALVLTFLPAILKVISDQRAAAEELPEPATPEHESEPAKEHADAYEEPVPTKPSSTAPISEHALSALERLERLD